MLKIQVYTICKNEIESIMPWYNCIKDEQDEIYITDTGSSDGTYEKFLELQQLDNKIHLQKIEIIPWRYDVQRNKALDFVPYEYDVTVSLDMDETLSTSWRPAIEEIWIKDETNVIIYDFIQSWSDTEESIPGLTFKNFKIHSRKNIRWKNLVHEVTERIDGNPQIILHSKKIKSEHHKKNKENSKDFYIPLILEAIKEDSENIVLWYQLGNQYFYNKQYTESVESNTQQINLYFKNSPIIHKGIIQRQMREIQDQYLSVQIKSKENRHNNFSNAFEWYLKTLSIEPHSKETWQTIGIICMSIKNYPLQYGCIKTAQSITNKNDSFVVIHKYWDENFLKKVEEDALQKIKDDICKE